MSGRLKRTAERGCGEAQGPGLGVKCKGQPVVVVVVVQEVMLVYARSY